MTSTGTTDETLYLLTWRLGYGGALDVAESASTGRRVVLVKLVSQDQPRTEELKRIQQGKRTLLAVGAEFSSVEQGVGITPEFAEALATAERHFKEGFGVMPPVLQREGSSGREGENAPAREGPSEEETTAFLRKMYRNGQDDGVR